ncbi:MAG TPA: hypothetical protein VLS89_18900, partial [Candidatus Nanopelagicales bacterium]|nr:hypothetical protein [Candidatus Nanopelagicales bacterium]
EAPGYATQKELAVFETDVSMDFDLERKAAANVSYRPRRDAASPPSDPSPEPTTKPTADEGLKQGTSSKPKRTLSSDPWAGSSPGAAGEATSKPKRTLSSDPWAR